MNRLEDFGINKQVNKTRLKVNVLEKFPEAQEQNDGKNTVIVFEEEMQNMLKEALKKRNFSEDVAILAKAPAIIRNDIFNHDHFHFTFTDTRIAVYILHAMEQGMKIIKVRTVDTDVVIILVGTYFNFVKIQPQVDV